MANIYDKASLVMIPSGTKTSKIFSQKPVNGDGDFTFSRSTSATRVNADGNIEKETQNLLTYSNDFSQWTFGGVTRTGGQSGYDGSNNAWLITATNVSGVNVNQIVNTSEVKTYSIYAKAGTTNWIRMSFNDTGINSRAWFDLTNGVVGTIIGNVIDTEITSLGSGWYRCSISVNLSVNSSSLYLFVVDGNGLTSASVGDSVYIQDAQLEVGLAATDYIESGASTGKAGLLEDEPRFDYPGGATCPSLLLEPSRTQLITQSEFFGSGSGWESISTSLAVITDNFGTSPEGLQNAAKLEFGGNNSWLAKTFSAGAGNDYSASVYLKVEDGGADFAAKLTYYPTGGGTRLDENITITSQWQRFDALFENVTTGSGGVNFVIRSNETRSCLVWGAQVEQASYPTSYIPNHSGGSVTRGADDCILTGASSIIGQTEGTLFWEGENIGDANAPYIAIYDGTTANRILFYYSTGGTKFNAQIRVGSAVQFQASSIDVSGKIKVALAYKENDFILYINGTARETDTSGITYTNELSIVDFGYSSFDAGKHNKFMLFKTRLSNEELAALTTI